MLAALFLLLAGLAVLRLDMLTVRQEGELFYAAPVKGEGQFSIRWVHSVEKEEWEEFFRLDDEEIIIDSTRFKTFGAGVPSHAGSGSFIKDGWVYMVDIDRPIGETLVIRTGEETSHRLIQKGNELVFPSGSDAYEIKKESLSVFQYAVYRLMHL